MKITMRLLATFAARAARPTANPKDAESLIMARAQRHVERGPSKLARRLTRKAALGQSGAF